MVENNFFLVKHTFFLIFAVFLITGCNLSEPIGSKFENSNNEITTTPIGQIAKTYQILPTQGITKSITQTPELFPTNSNTQSPSNEVTETKEISPCSDSYQSRLKNNTYAQVSTYPPLSSRVRSNAGTDFQVLGSISPGDVVKIIEGPKCANKWVWWKIYVESTGLTGWTSEGDFENYWLVPIQ
ncbi:MAG: SH3 domain-containing protein [Chloroflexi bacterium]|nr:SH3 domain-containing protein [Chloroflexota bacterium]